MPGLGNVDPHGYARLYALAQAGDWDAAKQEQERLMRLFELVGVGGAERMGRASSALGAFKAALYLRGVIANPRTALPYIQLDEAEIDRVKGHAAVRGHGHLDLHPRRPLGRHRLHRHHLPAAGQRARAADRIRGRRPRVQPLLAAHRRRHPVALAAGQAVPAGRRVAARHLAASRLGDRRSTRSHRRAARRERCRAGDHRGVGHRRDRVAAGALSRVLPFRTSAGNGQAQTS
ncbi:dihydrodipicolinate synthase family protein [Catenulispora sp. MAP12-49]|uniref:dihydrodipicolinate synthase family protein n=1 Tax=Catenulispora sp. MAP12-49 TaxID=3156302 RepID=UPI0035162257